MAKKGFFSWFRKDKTKEQEKVTTESAQEQIDTSHADQQAQEQEAARLAEEQRLQKEHEQAELEQAKQEQARLEAERLEQERLEQVALEQAKQEQARLEAERVEQERLQQERLEQERLAAEQLAAEQEAARIAEEQRQQQEREQAALEQAKQEQARLEAERVEQERLQQERLEQERLEQERLAEEQLAAEQEAAEQEAARIAEEERLAEEAQQTDAELIDEPQAKPAKEGLFARLKRGLLRTSENIGSGFMGIFRGKKIDDELFEELEEQLLIADVGVETTTRLIDSLTESASRKQLKDAEALYELMRDEMQKILDPVAIPLVPENSDGPYVILMVGVNGVGKTTTIGKLAKQYQKQGKSVMLAAGDTFRAAAVEQLQVWGQRNDIPVVAQHTGADSASVLFDALQAAKARNVDVLIADTAGRLQNKGHLMEELKKVVRVMKKLDPNAPHEVMLTLDASTGQNAISQAQLFQEAVGVTGITISKLDGTAKGGVIFAIADKFTIPIRHIGVGEQIDDLRTFNSNDFIEALFSQDKAE
ncbi:signal recognition particle-docking protein FtsY [Shewanella sp. UCD-FRSSP16_17]|uniref:signal recognition particle-docking protein FtsY n=1 Tax=Shewanella sp. UCD-FRSSP16_17 TaxID=1853256 RepID=UPI0007EEEAE5|nr:signal recognition particle-docking protein FtsY [Shewanella sp. UCD-FRSSP16_17]OBT05382.1 signal recognition particle-docking protein FtsY [Shewanella sp. UCD-FRSSP16_17]